MATKIGAQAQGIVDRLAAVDRRSPVIDRERAQRALDAHFIALGLPVKPVRWVTDAEAGYAAARRAAESAAWRAAWRAARRAAESAAWRAAESAARRAAESAAWRAARRAAESAAWRAAESAAWRAAESAAWRAARRAAESAAWRAAGHSHPAIDRYVGIWLPFVDAVEAGLWLFWVFDAEVIAAPRPAIQIEGDRLHCETGPAVQWPGGAEYFFWRGVQVPREIVLHPEAITVPRIDGETNAEVRRVLIERYGQSRFLVDGGAVVKHRDETGVLYWRDVADDEPLVMVKVRNSTPEPDGSSKSYFIRVPPQMKTAREAVAWTFGFSADRYQPAVET